MKNEEAQRAEEPELHEHNRRFEEQLFSAKDSVLRLWERTRHLQERLGQAETRLKRLTWLLIAILIGSPAMLTFILLALNRVFAPQQAVELQDRLIALQAHVHSLQASIHLLEEGHELLGRQHTARSVQNDTELAAAIQRLAPEIIARAFKDAIHVDANGQVGIGTAKPESPLHVVGNLLGAAKGSANEALRIVVGQLDPQTTHWVQYASGGIYADVDTSSAGFSATPLYFTSLGGHTNNWLARGVTSIYHPTPRGFRVHLSYPELTVTKAKEWGWYINWMAVGR
jgi:hypothetical protein